MNFKVRIYLDAGCEVWDVRFGMQGLGCGMCFPIIIVCLKLYVGKSFVNADHKRVKKGTQVLKC